MSLARLLIFPLIGASLAGPSLRGQDFFGFQAGIGFPKGEFKESTGGSAGYFLGAHQVRELGAGNVFRPRLDCYGFKGGQDLMVQTASGPVRGQLDNRFTILSAGLESMYYLLQDTHRGPYLFGGFGGASTRLTSEGSSNPTGDASTWPLNGKLQETANKFYYSMGVGFQYDSTFGGELRYFTTRWSGGGTSMRVAFISAGVTLRLH